MKERIDALMRAYAQRPDDPFIAYALAVEHTNLGSLGEAERFYSSVYSKHPHYVPNYLQYGMLLVRMGREGEAIDILKRGVTEARNAGDNHALSELEEAILGL